MTSSQKNAQAIVIEAPRQLAVRSLELKPFEVADVEVEVSFSGISTGTERLLWDGTMPPFPGLGYPLVPGCETVGRVVRVGDAAGAAGTADCQLGDHVFIPGSYSFQGVRNIFGGAGSRLIVQHDRVVKVQPELGPKAVLLALAVTGYHTVFEAIVEKILRKSFVGEFPESGRFMRSSQVGVDAAQLPATGRRRRGRRTAERLRG